VLLQTAKSQNYLMVFTHNAQLASFSSMASILVESHRVHNVTQGDAILSNTPGCTEDKMPWSDILFHSLQPSGSWSARRMFAFPLWRDTEAARQWPSALSDRAMWPK